jgi:hypothetical protein
MKTSAHPPAAAPTSAALAILSLWQAGTAATQEAAEPADEDRTIASAGMALLARMMLVRFALGATVLILAVTLILLS